MSILGFTVYAATIAGTFFLAGRLSHLSVFKGMGEGARYALVLAAIFFAVFGQLFMWQYLGINMGTFLMYHGRMLIPAGGI